MKIQFLGFLPLIILLVFIGILAWRDEGFRFDLIQIILVTFIVLFLVSVVFGLFWGLSAL